VPPCNDPLYMDGLHLSRRSPKIDLRYVIDLECERQIYADEVFEVEISHEFDLN